MRAVASALAVDLGWVLEVGEVGARPVSGRVVLVGAVLVADGVGNVPAWEIPGAVVAGLNAP